MAEPRKNSVYLLIGVGSQLTAMVVSGFLLGYGLDYWLNTLPIFMLIFAVLGFVGGMVRIFKLLMAVDKNE